MEIKAAVINNKGEDFQIDTIELDEPGFGEVLVRMVASGVCHTDMNVKDQTHRVPAPAVLGHEGAGVIEKLGPGVSDVELGDHVVLGFASCGRCQNCLQGYPFACAIFAELNFGGKMEDGTQRLHRSGQRISNFFGQSSFATYSVVNARNVVKVPKDIDLALLGPLGCGIQTGAGTVLNRFKPQPGSSIAVFGAGGVGLSAVMAANVVSCSTIIAIDMHDSRLELALELGATHVINASKNTNVVETIRSLSGGGVDYAIEAAGHPALLRQAVDCLTFLGTAAQIGGLPQGSEASIDSNDLRSRNKTITGIVEGDSVPRIFIPMLIDLYKAGRFPFDKMITFYDFDDINVAGADSHSGKAIKPVLRIS